MKTNWIRTMILSAAALTMGSAAFAQTRLGAEIPFSFRFNGAVMPAGHYSIEQPRIATSNILLLNNGHSARMGMGVNQLGRLQGDARLIFSCSETSGCTLTEVWYDSGAGVEFPKAKKLTPAEKERVAVVILHRSNAD